MSAGRGPDRLLYDATSGADLGDAPQRPVLEVAAVAEDSVHDDMMAALARLEAREETIRAREAERDVDPDELARLGRLLAEPGLPVGLQSLAGRVEDGRTTWAEVFADPTAHGQEGVDLVLTLMDRTARELGTARR